MTRPRPSQQAEPGMRRCNEWSIDVQADAYKCGQGAAWVLAALHMSNAYYNFFARITIFGSITIFVAGLQGPRAAMSRRTAIQIPARNQADVKNRKSPPAPPGQRDSWRRHAKGTRRGAAFTGRITGVWSSYRPRARQQILRLSFETVIAWNGYRPRCEEWASWLCESASETTAPARPLA